MPTASPFSHVIDQFVEESSFLWELLSKAISAPHYNLEKLLELKERLKAQIDGLRSCEDDGWRLVKERIADKPATGERFTAAVLAIESSDPNRLEQVLLSITKPAHARELASALTWYPFNKVQVLCDRFLALPAPLLQLAALSAYVDIRKDPGKHLDAALGSPDQFIRCRALQAIGELNLVAKVQVAKAHFCDEDPACAFRAAWSAALLGDLAGVQTLLSFVNKKSPFADEAAAVAFRRLGVRGGPVVIDGFAKTPDSLRWAIIGTGALGDPSRIPWLLERMNDPVYSRVSGEALSMITGLDIAKSHMDIDAPEDFEETPNDDPKDEKVDLDADNFLPWPNIANVNAWWEGYSADVTPGNRYLCGKPISLEGLAAILINGYQRQRSAAAIECLSLKPGEPLFAILA